MFKILVADDEKFIRKGIITILERDLEEEVECLEAKNGLEALEIAKTENLNLIVTDISMPGLDGLEFIKSLKEINHSANVIILSGYENFDFARTAIKLGVKEYVMKPIIKKEFLELIRGYIINIKNVETHTKEEIIRKIENNKLMRQMKNDFLVGLLNCATSPEAETYLTKLQSLGITFRPMLFVCAVVQYKFKEENADFLDFAVMNILEEYLNLQQGIGSIVTVKYDSGKVVVIFEGEDQRYLKEPAKKLLRKAGQLIKDYYQVDVFIGLGDIAYDSVHLHTSLRHALAAADFKIYGGADNIEIYSNIQNGPEYPEIRLEKLIKPWETANAIQAANAFDKLCNEPKSKRAMNTIKKAYSEIQNAVEIGIIHLQNPETKSNLTVKNFSEFWSFTELKREIRYGIIQMQEAFQNRENNVSSIKLRSDIIRFIQNNITKELDLNIVAEQFSRTPGYISKLFKQGNEEGFNSYITNERIKIAKKLLQDSSVPIQQVSELCGYPNSKYFSVVFKKATGESPKSYRENH